MELRIRGRRQRWRDELPEEALPDCVGCSKPEIRPEDAEAVMVYQAISNQQTFNYVSGHRLGLRFEAVVAAVRWYHERGVIEDPDGVMEKIWIIDDAVNKHFNSLIEPGKSGQS